MMSGRHRQNGRLRLAVSFGLAAGAIYLAGCGAGTTGLNQSNQANTSRTGADRDVATGNRKAEGTVGRMGLYLSITPGPYHAGSTKAAAKKEGASTDTTSDAVKASPSPAASPVAIAAVVASAAAATPAVPSAPLPDHLWVTVLKVELIDGDEKAVSVFDDAQGQTIDLMSLGATPGSARRFVPLACAAPPAGKSYNRVRVTFDKAFLAFAPGKTSADTKPVADDIPRDNEGRPVISFTMSKGRELGSGKENLVVDVDLSRTDLSSERISPALREGSRDGLIDLTRQDAVAFSGTVSEVTTKAGETVFALALPANRTLMVQSGDATVFTADGSGKNPALKEGATIQVRGTLSPESKRLVASDIRVFDGTQKLAMDAATLRGKVISYDAKADTVTVAVRQVENFQPTQANVVVSLPKEASFRSSGGLLLTAAEFTGQLKAGTTAPLFVTVEGAYEAASGALTATRARLEPAKPSATHEAEVFGLAKDVNPQGGKLTVESASEWQGFMPVSGAPIAVTAAPNATYLTEDGKAVTRTEFFTSAAEKASGVRVVGTYTGGKVTATRLSLAPAPVAPKPETKKDIAKTDEDSTKAEKPESETPTDKATKPVETARPVESGAKAPEKTSEKAPTPEAKPAAKPATPSPVVAG